MKKLILQSLLLGNLKPLFNLEVYQIPAKIVDSTVVQPVTNTKLYKNATENLNEEFTSNDYGFLTKERKIEIRERLMREKNEQKKIISRIFAVDEELVQL